MPSSMDDKESTPLLFSAKGGGRLDPSNHVVTTNDGPQRRRGGGGGLGAMSGHHLHNDAANATAAPTAAAHASAHPAAFHRSHAGPDPDAVNFKRTTTSKQPPLQQQQQHYFGGKFDPPAPIFVEQTPIRSTNNKEEEAYSKYNKQRLFSLSPGGTTPLMHKMYTTYSALRENWTRYSRPPLQRGGKQYYEDNYNDLSWRCSFGTRHEDGIWLNHGDSPGLFMASLVWLMIVYAGFTVTLLAKNNSLPSFVSITYCTLCALALASHAKTTLTDPGSIPPNAIPNDADALKQHIKYCNICQTYKPPKCHHCRICDRCISGMDHHCPWMNNCIGSGNLKHFFLFLIYVWIASSYALILFGINYFMCNSDECIFPNGLIALVRLMTLLCIGAVIFTSNMIMSVFWGVMTGMGTIDRMKKQESNTFDESDEPPIPWTDVFGMGSYLTWLLPVDPLFDDYDRIMGYATVDRLEREKDTIL